MTAAVSDAKPRLVLHVGAFKTATSTLQSLFSLHEQEIAAAYGIHYPKAFRRVNMGSIIADHPRTDSYAHHMIAHLLRRSERRELARQFRDMAEAFRASGCRSLLLSTELLSFCPRDDKAFILDHLAGFDVRVVYAVRNPVDYIESMNNQTLKSGERLQRPRERAEAPRTIPFLESIEDWIALVGAQNTFVLPFASAWFEPFCRRFLAVFEDPALTAFAIARMPRTNSSISAEGARLRTMFNRYLPRPRHMDRKQRHIVTRLIVELDAGLKRRTPLVTVDSAERQTILEANRAGIDAICARFLPPETWDLVKEPERGLVASRSSPDDMAFSTRDVERIAACLMRARALFEDGAAEGEAAPEE